MMTLKYTKLSNFELIPIASSYLVLLLNILSFEERTI